MKVLIAICVLIGLASADVFSLDPDDRPKFMEECAKELAIPMDLMEKYLEVKHSEDPKAMCYYRCILYRIYLGNLITDYTEEVHADLAACMNNITSDPMPASTVARCGSFEPKLALFFFSLALWPFFIEFGSGSGNRACE
ncbi:general odorant-binding protein 99a-like [Drosophila ficusphila]|uniref:general odorant-binding protein 99a-like n=1 Tax=Drosophila ficusphila TaxID=30025 RepID=UPI001C8A8508|nr:general odorant-binding protein 99a-like [Drosophila ficusphila]